jgi:hypothetical protein
MRPVGYCVSNIGNDSVLTSKWIGAVAQLAPTSAKLAAFVQHGVVEFRNINTIPDRHKGSSFRTTREPQNR